MNAERLAELRNLAENATQGEWYRHNGPHYAEIRTDGSDRSICHVAYCEDASYIAAASPATVLQLLDEIERLNKIPTGQTEIAELKQQLSTANARIAELTVETRPVLYWRNRAEQAEAQCAAMQEVLEEIDRQRNKHSWADSPRLGFLCEKGLSYKTGRKILNRMKRMESYLNELAYNFNNPSWIRDGAIDAMREEVQE